MKVALVAESFLPHTNGVTNSILRVIEYLTARGDEALVIAPQSKSDDGPRHYGAATITRVPSVGCPGYRDVRLSIASESLVSVLLEGYEPDVVHLASPFILGWTAVKAAASLGLPTVAVYQTEVPSYAEQYRIGWGEPLLWNRVRTIHDRATMTLVPSTYAMGQLERLGVERLRLWPRGVDSRRFAPSKRSDALRRAWAPNGEVIVGYVGRLAPEKRVGDLARLAGIPGVSVVIVGDGPSASRLRADMPNAHFPGFMGGDDLARAMASFDIFAHCGEFETFCQAIQEAHASGVPAIAPRRGGPIDLITEGRNGHLYEPGDLDAMVGHVRRLADDADLRARYAADARATVEHRTWHSVCDALLDHYRDAIEATSLRRQLSRGGGVVRIAHLANFYGPTSGGLRTVMHHLGEGYRERGHEVLLVVPGPRDADEETPYGRKITVASPAMPFFGGYRVIVRLAHVRRVLVEWQPDRIEVSDRTTLRGFGRWAERRGIHATFFSHERADGVIRSLVPGPLLSILPVRPLIDAHNRGTARRFARVVCTTAFAAEEFDRIGQPSQRIPLGVDLDHFRPERANCGTRATYASGGEALLVMASRLSREKRPDLAIEAVRILSASGRSVRLTCAGTGAIARRVESLARGLPVTFLGFLADRDAYANLLASADVVLAPGPIETFGLAALEALASGVPVVVNAASALPEVIGGGGLAAVGTPKEFARAIEAILDRPVAERRIAARASAERFPWSATVDRLLDVPAFATS